MGTIWTTRDIASMVKTFGINCLWYESRLSADLKNGITRLNSDAILGFKYNLPVAVRLIKSSVSQHIVNSPEGNIYEGGAKFEIPPIVMIAGVVTPLTIYNRIFKGDVIVVPTKPIRDFDVLTKGKRDYLFAFDVRTILSVKSVPLGNSKYPSDHIEVSYNYGVDYKIQINFVDADVTINPDNTVTINTPVPNQVAANINFVWLNNESPNLFPTPGRPSIGYEIDETPIVRNNPPDGVQYVVEFSAAPNYVIWDELAKARGTEENDLPKMVMAVKRAYFNSAPNPVDSIPVNQPVQEVL